MNQMLKIAELFNAVLDREMGKTEEDGLISITINWKGVISVHLCDEYFQEHFGDVDCKMIDQPRCKNVRVSFETDSGHEFFCLKPAKFERVA